MEENLGLLGINQSLTRDQREISCVGQVVLLTLAERFLPLFWKNGVLAAVSGGQRGPPAWFNKALAVFVCE